MKLRYPLVLASQSPRRQELLRRIVPEFTVHPSHIDEDDFTSVDPFDTARQLAHAKAEAIAADHPGCLILGGDTVVTLPEPGIWPQLAKPVDEEDAVHMLTRLQGRSHVVITGIALIGPNGERVRAVASTVTFRPLTESEIRAYVATGESMDKAGAYGLQGGAKDFVTRIKGSRSCVIGLPLFQVRQFLADYAESDATG